MPSYFFGLKVHAENKKQNPFLVLQGFKKMPNTLQSRQVGSFKLFWHIFLLIAKLTLHLQSEKI
jgi:hypothetical protein